ncbi:UDP-glucuronosyltransferase 2a1-like [Plakobranchus ocellatus]|uniref:UDP-glucuronosyltransferase 2a1-like n=1 Tax=Plakobranchus ocellatus TaxID=259542 RepID=A0AAV4DI96_9GAST|nr:UDP-glucuronosyltransferase 2a1-like [Plakobranchus ocellatus]
MERMKLYILGLSEVRWKGAGKITSCGHEIIYSGGTESEKGVGIIEDQTVSKAIKGHWALSDRVFLVKIAGKPVDLNIIQVYAPTANSNDEDLDKFYNDLDTAKTQCKSQDPLIIMGDFNAKVGTDKVDDIVGKHGRGIRYERVQNKFEALGDAEELEQQWENFKSAIMEAATENSDENMEGSWEEVKPKQKKYRQTTLDFAGVSPSASGSSTPTTRKAVAKKNAASGSSFFLRAADRDTENYRLGYPGQEDNLRLNANLEFYQGKISSYPDGAFIDDIHNHWWGNYELLERHHGYIQWIFPIRENGMNWQAQALQLHEAEVCSDWVPSLISNLFLFFEANSFFFPLRLQFFSM